MSETFAEKIEIRKGLPSWFNFLSALIGLIILFPFFLMVAVLIKLTSKGPVFFKQKRVGLNGEDFFLYKFRTMRVNNEGLKITSKNDIRVTKIGKLLRQMKLDEFPQLVNVIKGEMAIVGPRPEVKEYTDLHPEMWKIILKVKPGITDPVTLRLRNEEELLAKSENPQEFYSRFLSRYKAEGYIDYLKKRSFFYDMKIIFKTLEGVIIPGMCKEPDFDEIFRGYNGERK